MSFRMAAASEAKFLRRGRAAAEQRSANRCWEYIVEIKMQLAEKADAGPAGAVDREYRFGTDLEVGAHPYQARIGRSGGDRTIPEIVGDRRRELRLNYRKQVIDEIGQLVIVNLRFQIRHAVLDGSAVGQYLGNKGVLHDIE